MDKIQLTIALTEEYQQSVNKAKEQNDLSKCRSWIELLNASGNNVQVELNNNCLILRCNTPKGQVEESCTYAGVLSVTEMRNGILLRLSHKRLLFLPVSENGEENLRLMDAVVMLTEHCACVFCRSPLALHNVGLMSRLQFGFRKKRGHYTGSGYLTVALAVLILFTFIMGTVFVTEPIRNRKVDPTQAQVYTLAFEGAEPSYRKSTIRSIRLDFSDGQHYYVENNCATEELNSQLQKITPGTSLNITVHPYSESIIEIVSESCVLLDFDEAQKTLWNEAVTFAVLGMLVYVIDAFLILVMIRKKYGW